MDEATLKVLVQRADANDAGALADLYREFRPRVFGLCRYMLGSREEAEDATSEIFARLQRAMKSYDASLPFPRWLLSITGHYCVDLLRKRRLEQRVFASTSPDCLSAPPPPPCHYKSCSPRSLAKPCGGDRGIGRAVPSSTGAPILQRPSGDENRGHTGINARQRCGPDLPAKQNCART